MAVQLNHTIVHAHDPDESARFYTAVLGLPDHTSFGPFLVVQLDNDVSLDLIAAGDTEVVPQHYAFLVSEGEFDEIFGRITARGLPYYADPGRRREGEIYREWGGRGCYFSDPSGNVLEILTVPYGGWPEDR